MVYSAWEFSSIVTSLQMNDLRAGLELGPTEWRVVEQARINAFADATDDQQWIHVDSVKAAEGPFGGTIAHGYLTLSLLAPFSYELLAVSDARMTVNYGFDRVRFPAPVPAGSRLRGVFKITEVTEVEGGLQVNVNAAIEREGGNKPVCVAEILYRYYC
jgi:acyl dehydratase